MTSLRLLAKLQWTLEQYRLHLWNSFLKCYNQLLVHSSDSWASLLPGPHPWASLLWPTWFSFDNLHETLLFREDHRRWRDEVFKLEEERKYTIASLSEQKPSKLAKWRQTAARFNQILGAARHSFSVKWGLQIHQHITSTQRCCDNHQILHLALMANLSL